MITALILVNLLIKFSYSSQIDLIENESEIDKTLSILILDKHLLNSFKLLDDEIRLYSSENNQLIKKYQKSPIVFFRKNRFLSYNSDDLTQESIDNWIFESKDRLSFDLNDSNFEHDTQASTGMTTGDWFVVFYKDSCTNIEYIIEESSIKLKGILLFAYVDINSNPKLKERFKLEENSLPIYLYLTKGKMYYYKLDTLSFESINSFTQNGFYRNYKAFDIPKELSSFDFLLNEIVDELKRGNSTYWLVIYALLGAIVIGCIYLALRATRPCNKQLKNE